MARKPRIHQPGGFYHVILRGNGGDPIFFTPRDRIFFLSLIADGIARFRFRVHAFCLMNNHVHLALQPGDIPLSKIMQTIAFRHTRHINKHKKRVGHLFQGRYKAILVDKNRYLLELVRYIHLNPVRAKLVNDPADWPWNGHNAYLGKSAMEWLTTETVLGMFGGQFEAARAGYSKFIAEGTADGTADALRKGNDGGRILGDDRFAERVLKKLSIDETGKKIPLSRVVKAVARHLGVDRSDIFSASRERALAQARALICLVARRHCGITLSELAAMLGRDDGGLSRTVGRFKEEMERDGRKSQLVAQITNELMRQ